METHHFNAHAMTHLIVSRDFRLHYMDLYSGNDSVETMARMADIVPSSTIPKNREYFGIKPTVEFPLLGDFWIAAIVSMVVHLRHENHGLKIKESSPNFQGWAERVARSFGLRGLQVPTSMRKRLALRVKVFFMMHKEMHEDAL
jgi:hypothetical protein